ncbi:phage virion morphogenesis protein [Morganella morganii]|uniref:phage virion morphogenesis protein n=1 Tax=Morganella morganii TaxID=582 RepID=UPI003BFA6E35
MADAVEETLHRRGVRNGWDGVRQRRRRRGGRILQLSGRLAGSIGSYSDNDSAVVGTNVKYAVSIRKAGKSVCRPQQQTYYAGGKTALS